MQGFPSPQSWVFWSISSGFVRGKKNAPIKMNIMHQSSDLSTSLKQLHNRSRGTHWRRVKKRGVSLHHGVPDSFLCTVLLESESIMEKQLKLLLGHRTHRSVTAGTWWWHTCVTASAAGEALRIDVCSWRGTAFGSFTRQSSAFSCSLPTSRACAVLVVVLLFPLTHTEPSLSWKILSCLFPFLLL